MMAHFLSRTESTQHTSRRGARLDDTVSPAFRLAPPRKQEETTQEGFVVHPHLRSNGSHAGMAAVERGRPEAKVAGYTK